MGFYAALNRPFDSVIDWRYLGSAVGLVDDSVGRTAGDRRRWSSRRWPSLALLVLMPLALLRLARVATRHRGGRCGWPSPLGAALGRSARCSACTRPPACRSPRPARPRVRLRPGEPDPLRAARPARLRPGGAGRPARVVRRPASCSPGCAARTCCSCSSRATAGSRSQDSDDGARRRPRSSTTAPAGSTRPASRSRSAFLTSPTFGAISWLAHSTLQSGLWVDSQQRYDVLVTSPRLHAQPGLRAGRLAHGQRRPGRHPRLAAGRVLPLRPALRLAQRRLPRARGSATRRCPTSTPSTRSTGSSSRRQHRRPVMAEIDLITSHAPWSRTPHMIDQAAVGDGSVFDGMPEQAPSETVHLALARPGAGGVRPVHRVLPDGARVVPRALRRRRHGAGLPRRPPAGPDRLRRATPTTTCRSRWSPRTRPCSAASTPGSWQPGSAPGPRRAGVADGRVPRPVPAAFGP